jgi:ubiquinone/menaquinone biosynthesis C-methylase UbiE
VIDLGSGAGNDVFVARRIVGEKGKVIGVDMTEAMIEKANNNNAKLGYKNVEFRIGDIENMPVADNTADVVISNCVLNLVPDKKKAFKEIYRTMKPGGHFSISDVVIKGELPKAIKSAAEMYAGCVSGAIEKDAYLKIIKDCGFKKVTIFKEKKIEIPDETLGEYLDEKAMKKFKTSETLISSITVYGEK